MRCKVSTLTGCLQLCSHPGRSLAEDPCSWELNAAKIEEERSRVHPHGGEQNRLKPTPPPKPLPRMDLLRGSKEKRS